MSAIKKTWGWRFKRIRNALKAKRDPLAFATATLELHLLRRLADAHYLDL